MFQSATFKLTTWYIAILMAISLLFSVIIYQTATSEVRTRLERFEAGILNQPLFPSGSDFDIEIIRSYQARQAANNLIVSLIYTNLLILLAGGFGAYLLARRTLQPIRESLEAQARFSSDASHELRTPLAAMKMELEVAMRDPKLSKVEMKEILASNLEEVDKLSELSDILLKLSRDEQNGLTMEEVDLESILRDTVKRTREPKRFDLPESTPRLKLIANRSSLAEAIYIILDNALKYGDKNTPIDISVKRRAARVHIKITNKGEGIEDKHLPHIFNRFYRADGSRTNGDKSGYGLGLSVARQLVKLHRGDISVVSNPGATTSFTISLPIKHF